MKATTFLLFALITSVSVFANPLHNSYPIIIKFNSIGTGIPSDKPLLDFISAFKKKYKIKKISYDKIGPMGREGEYHMAFKLKEMNKARAAAFIKGVKKTIPLMKDRGSAEVELNGNVDKASLGRTTITQMSL